MARPIRADGTPFPRKRPVDWEIVRQVLSHRRFHRDITAQGFREVGHFGPWSLTQNGQRISDCKVHPDGTRLYVKITEQPKNGETEKTTARK